uniref:Uncharacterized protein n=1 Tax=Oryza barthii TaxID=65489 RepID=A0A0D3ENK0_9ORYZ
MANLNSYHLATWADSAKTRNPTGPGSSYENMWLHIRLRSMTYEVKSLIDQGNLPNYNSTQLNRTSSGVGKRRRRLIRWRSTELRDDVEMTHRRRAADAGVEEERGKRRGRKRGLASGLYQRLRCGRKTVTTTARLLAAARSNGGGGSGFGKRGKKGRWPAVFIEEGVARVRAHDASFGKAAAPNLAARLAGFCGGRVGLRRGLGRRQLGPGT